MVIRDIPKYLESKSRNEEETSTSKSTTEDVDEEPCKIGCTRVKRASVRGNGKDEYVRGCVHDGDESNRSVPRLASEVTGFTRWWWPTSWPTIVSCVSTIGRISEPRSIDRFYYSGDLLDRCVAHGNENTAPLLPPLPAQLIESRWNPTSCAWNNSISFVWDIYIYNFRDCLKRSPSKTLSNVSTLYCRSK